jgi:hypothetical protein
MVGCFVLAVEQDVDRDAICRLMEGDVGQWRGLGRLERAEFPSCVGLPVERGTIRFRLMLLAVDTYRAASGQAELHVYSAINDGAIELIEVIPSRPPAAAALLDELGAPSATHVHSVQERAAANLPVPSGGTIEEAIYAGRGLAITIAREAGGSAAVIRLRGFEPMPDRYYLDQYVRFEPESL